MLFKTNGIVFHQIKYSESSVIAKIYTELFGIQSYLIKGVRSKKSKIKSALLQHLSLVDLVVYHKEKSNIQYIKEIRSAYQFTSIPFDIRKSSITVFINEVLYKSIHEEEANQNLFDYLFNSIKLLDMTTKNFVDFHLLFTIGLTKYLGFFPRGNFSDKKTVFDLQEGFFQNAVPNHSNYLKKPLSEIFYNLLNTPIEHMDSVKISYFQRNELLNKIIEYYRLHLPAFKDIKSPDILKEVLS